MVDDCEAFVKNICLKAIEAADPLVVLPKYWEEKGFEHKSYKVIGAGKASASMALALENILGQDLVEGVVVTRYGYGAPTSKIKVIEASHPVPDAFGVHAADEIISFLEGCDEDDHVIALISGGGSALLSKPAECLSFEEKQDINQQLLHSGASIHEINTVRKHISAVKGGGLKKYIGSAKLTTFIVSDVTGDVPNMIASGPTLGDPTTQAQALSVLEKYNINVSDSVIAWLKDPANETEKTIDKEDVHVIATGKTSLNAAKDYAEEHGVKVIDLGDGIEGDAGEVARDQIAKIQAYNHSLPVAFISGGETTVKVQKDGKGGRNAHYILSALIESQGQNDLYAAAVDTDGIDGSEDNAGAFFSPEAFVKSSQAGINLQEFLEKTNSYDALKRLGLLIHTKPTCTNVNDFRVLLKV